MYKLAAIIVAAVLVSGCAAPAKNRSQNDYYAKETALRNAYQDCIKREGKGSPKCSKEKDELLEQIEWNLLDEYT